MNATDSVLRQLMSVIEQRKRELPARSYTTTLFQAGTAKIGAKITEEAREVVEAAAEPGEAGREHLQHEAADLLYHLLVLLAHRETSLAEVERVLAGRFGISGIDEKESRSS